MSKKFLISVGLLFGAMTVGACGAGLAIKVYKPNYEKGGLYRIQEDELVAWKDADDYYCTNAAGFRKLLETWKIYRDLADSQNK